jgi:hypothetical protein
MLMGSGGQIPWGWILLALALALLAYAVSTGADSVVTTVGTYWWVVLPLAFVGVLVLV